MTVTDLSSIIIEVAQPYDNVCEGINDTIPTSIHFDGVKGIRLSNICGEEQHCPATPLPVLTRVECGLSQTILLLYSYHVSRRNIRRRIK